MKPKVLFFEEAIDSMGIQCLQCLQHIHCISSESSDGFGQHKINRVLERVHLPASEDREGEDLSNILTDMEDYVTLESAWIDDDPNEETNKLITVHYGSRTLRGLRVWEVVKMDLLARIEKNLDTIRNEHFSTMSMKKPRKRKQAQRNSEGSGIDG